MKKVLFLSPYPLNKAPSQRFKYEQYYPCFENAGYELTTSSFIDEQFWRFIYEPGHIVKKVLYTFKGYLRRTKDLLRVRQYDIVYVHLWVTPLGPPLLEWLVCLLARKVIYDIDDLIFLNPRSRSNPLVRYLKGAAKSKYLMRCANHVITCTPYLDSFARRLNKNTTDISSTIDTDKYVPVNRYTNEGTVVLGWSGSRHNSRYVRLLEKVLVEVRREIEFKLLVIGDSDFRIEGLDVIAIPWSAATEVSDLQKIDIGLYPLTDEELVQGKSGLKALQYMALGIPTIATAIGANFRVMEDGVSGFLVRGEEEWRDKIRLLISLPELRREIGRNGRKRVEDLFSVRANRSRYLEILAGI